MQTWVLHFCLNMQQMHRCCDFLSRRFFKIDCKHTDTRKLVGGGLHCEMQVARPNSECLMIWKNLLYLLFFFQSLKVGQHSFVENRNWIINKSYYMKPPTKKCKSFANRSQLAKHLARNWHLKLFCLFFFYVVLCFGIFFKKIKDEASSKNEH